MEGSTIVPLALAPCRPFSLPSLDKEGKEKERGGGVKEGKERQGFTYRI
jgi:hypothetical protein